MIFEVGDRVRVSKLDDDALSGIEVGFLGTGTKILDKNFNYPIKVRLDDIYDYFVFKEEEIELYKENEMEKTFIEVIKDIKEGEVWEESTVKIVKSNNSISIHIGEEVDVLEYTDDFRKFKLRRKEYTFHEAFKAYEEGKEIESCSYRYKKIDNMDHYYSTLSKEWQGAIIDFGLAEIRGKWYINS